MLQKDGFFRRQRDENLFRPAQPVTPTPAPAPAPAPSAMPKQTDTAEAKLDSRVLEITEDGVFQGTIAVDQAEIHGRFEGDLTVRKQLVIQGTGKVSGKIRYARIKVEEGAELAGEISMLDKAQDGVAATRRAA